jgi:hypothetical protein
MAAIPKVVVDGAIQETLRGDSERQLLAQETAETCRSDWSHWSVLEDASLVHDETWSGFPADEHRWGSLLTRRRGADTAHTQVSTHGRRRPSVRPCRSASQSDRQGQTDASQKSK